MILASAIDQRTNMKTILLLISLFYFSDAQPARTITITNKCPNAYYYWPTPNAAPGSCIAGCMAGTTCNSATGNCYWTVPAPSNGNFLVQPGQSSTLTFPYYNNGQAATWYGNFGFCGLHQPCLQDAATCSSVGCGVKNGPYTLAEIALEKLTNDFYDVSAIGGISVPVSMGPVGLSASKTQQGPYACGVPGATTPTTSPIGAATWNACPDAPGYQWVAPNASASSCGKNSDCPLGQVCGMSLTIGLPASQNPYRLNCGSLLGFWGPSILCSWNNNPSNVYTTPLPYQCNTQVSTPLGAATVHQFLDCDITSGTCYHSGATNGCCGCPNWSQTIGTQYVPSGADATCSNANAVWNSQIFPIVSWLKKACPTCYAYPFDDPTSTFNCGNMDANGYNTANYEIILCPAGQTLSNGCDPNNAPTTASATTTTSATSGKPTTSTTSATTATTSTTAKATTSSTTTTTSTTSKTVTTATTSTTSKPSTTSTTSTTSAKSTTSATSASASTTAKATTSTTSPASTSSTTAKSTTLSSATTASSSSTSGKPTSSTTGSTTSTTLTPTTASTASKPTTTSSTTGTTSSTSTTSTTKPTATTTTVKSTTSATTASTSTTSKPSTTTSTTSTTSTPTTTSTPPTTSSTSKSSTSTTSKAPTSTSSTITSSSSSSTTPSTMAATILHPEVNQTSANATSGSSSVPTTSGTNSTTAAATTNSTTTAESSTTSKSTTTAKSTTFRPGTTSTTWDVHNSSSEVTTPSSRASSCAVSMVLFVIAVALYL